MSEKILPRLNKILTRIIKAFVFFWLLLCVYRLLFILGMSEYIKDASSYDSVLTAIFSGAKLSLQTAGAMSLFMLAGFAAEALWRRLKYFRFICSFTVIFVTTLLFIARFPFYRQFHSGFNQMLFTAAHEDLYALCMSLIEQFQLPLKLLFVAVLACILNYAFNKFLTYEITFVKFLKLPKLPQWLKTALLCAFIYVFGLLSLYGGGWSWRTGVNWENAGVTNDTFLNESILDDYQAIYRAYANQMRMQACNGLSFTAQDVRSLAKDLTGKDGGSDLAAYLIKEAPGAKIEKPRHIFFIISESYANWPLLDKYAGLHIGDQMKNIVAQDDTLYVPAMLPSGSSTVGALMTAVTGLANSNLYLTTMPIALEKPYLTAAAPQMKKLGYKTSFWYSGPATWENIQKFALAQGFDNFYSRGSLSPDASGSVWGADDEYLYDAVLENIDDTENTFSIIMNTSNHSPFNIDLSGKGFNAETVKNALPEEARSDQELIKELGHFWYADKSAGEFIAKAKAKYPNSLFIFVGDHADRYNTDKTPPMYERYAVPLIITGAGIKKDMLPKDAAGSQIDIMPTVFDLIAPQGFEYYSVGRSLTVSKLGESYAFWITADAVGNTDELTDSPQYFGAQKLPNRAYLETYINAVRAVSWWLGAHGQIIDDSLLQ